jgi:anti-sigma B factor antagonist
MEGIQVSIDKVDLSPDTFLIKVGGYVDTTTSQELDRTLEDLLKKEVIRFVIDLEDVDYISSAGWGIFISEIKAIRRKGGDIKLVKMAPDVLEVFELLEFHRILKSYDSVDEALTDFQSGSTSDLMMEDDMGDNERVLVEDPSPVSDLLPSVEEKELSLEDKIKAIVKGNPEYGIAEIRNRLMMDRYGNDCVSRIRLYITLRKMGLHSIKKRILFSRSGKA